MEIVGGSRAPYYTIRYESILDEVVKGTQCDVSISGVHKKANAGTLGYYSLEGEIINWGSGSYEFCKYYGGGSNGTVYGVRKEEEELTIKIVSGNNKIEEMVLIYMRAYCGQWNRVRARVPMIVGAITNIRLSALYGMGEGWRGRLTEEEEKFYRDKVVGRKLRGIVTKPVEGMVGDLFECMVGDEIEEFEWQEYFKYCSKDVLDGLKILHECGFIHNDIKLENILVSYEAGGGYRFTLIDFGNVMRYRSGETHCPEGVESMGTTAGYSTENHMACKGISRRMDLCQFCYVLFEVVYGVQMYWTGYKTRTLKYAGIREFLGRFCVGNEATRYGAFRRLVEFSRTTDCDKFKSNLESLLSSGAGAAAAQVKTTGPMVYPEFYDAYDELPKFERGLITEEMCALWIYCFDLGYSDAPDYLFIENELAGIVKLMRRQ